MKFKLLVGIVTVAVAALLLSASAQMPGGDGHMPPGGQGRGDGMPSHPREGYMDRGFMGGSENMNVTGTVEVNDAGILLSLSVRPTDEMIERMDEMHRDMEGRGMGGMGGQGMMDEDDMPSPDEMVNKINVSITGLVEFEDSGVPGFDLNDTVVSSYALNSSTLNDLVHESTEEEETYSVSTPDGVFLMELSVNKSSSLILEWKWSLTIHYPFESNTSQLAVVHEVSILHHEMGQGMGHMGNPGQVGETMSYSNRTLFANKGMVPIFFKWLDSAVVDGQTVPVTATSTPSIFALSMVQGSDIYYDPSIGVEQSDILSAEDYISSILSGDFVDGILSPSVGGLVIATVGVLAIIVALNWKRLAKK